MTEVAKRHGSHSEKTALKDSVSFCAFPSCNRGLELARLPECFHVIDMTKVYGMQGFFRGTITFYLAKCQSFFITLV